MSLPPEPVSAQEASANQCVLWTGHVPRFSYAQALSAQWLRHIAPSCERLTVRTFALSNGGWFFAPEDLPSMPWWQRCVPLTIPDEQVIRYATPRAAGIIASLLAYRKRLGTPP